MLFKTAESAFELSCGNRYSSEALREILATVSIKSAGNIYRSINFDFIIPKSYHNLKNGARYGINISR